MPTEETPREATETYTLGGTPRVHARRATADPKSRETGRGRSDAVGAFCSRVGAIPTRVGAFLLMWVSISRNRPAEPQVAGGSGRENRTHMNHMAPTRDRSHPHGRRAVRSRDGGATALLPTGRSAMHPPPTGQPLEEARAPPAGGRPTLDGTRPPRSRQRAPSHGPPRTGASPWCAGCKFGPHDGHTPVTRAEPLGPGSYLSNFGR